MVKVFNNVSIDPHLVKGGQFTAVCMEKGPVNVVLSGVFGGPVALALEEVGELGGQFTAVVAKLIKHVVPRVAFKVFNGIKPLFISFFRVKVKDRGIPKAVNFRLCEDSVGKVLQFSVGGRAHAKARQSILNGKRNEVAISGLDALQSSNTDAFVTDIMAKHLPLSGGVNAGWMVSEGILVHDANHRAFVGVDNTSTSSNLEGIHAMVVNPLNVNLTVW